MEPSEFVRCVYLVIGLVIVGIKLIYMAESIRGESRKAESSDDIMESTQTPTLEESEL